MRILLAEDDCAMSQAICYILTCHHYMVDAVYNGEDAMIYALAQSYDGMILDIMMPKMDGLSVLKKLRAMGNRTPIMLVTAQTDLEMKIEGLNIGADDYLCKPFSLRELLARVHAMLRRRDSYVPDIFCCGNISLDQGRHVLSGDHGACQLSHLEFQLIELFLRNPQITFSADMLLERVWGCDSQAQVDTVWVYISYLRKKLKALHADVEIRSKRGVGYSLEYKNK